MSDRGLPESNDSTKSCRLPTKKKTKKNKPKPIVVSSDSESEPEVKKEKPSKPYDNYKDACNRDINNYIIS
jgi:hypothetical protein